MRNDGKRLNAVMKKEGRSKKINIAKKYNQKLLCFSFVRKDLLDGKFWLRSLVRSLRLSEARWGLLMVSLLLFHPLCGLHLPFVSNIVLSNFERRLKNWDSDTKGSTNFKCVFSTIFGSFSKRLATLQNFTVANLVLCLLILFLCTNIKLSFILQSNYNWT